MDEQLAESKRQFEETKRIEYLPCFDIHMEEQNAGLSQSIELTTILDGKVIFRGYDLYIDNIGKGIAKELQCLIATEYAEQPIGSLIPLIPSQKHITLYPLFIADTKGFHNYELRATLTLTFDDLLENHYEQSVAVRFSLNHDTMEMEIERINAPIVHNKENSDD